MNDTTARRICFAMFGFAAVGMLATLGSITLLSGRTALIVEVAALIIGSVIPQEVAMSFQWRSGGRKPLVIPGIRGDAWSLLLVWTLIVTILRPLATPALSASFMVNLVCALRSLVSLASRMHFLEHQAEEASSS